MYSINTTLDVILRSIMSSVTIYALFPQGKYAEREKREKREKRKKKRETRKEKREERKEKREKKEDGCEIRRCRVK